MIHGHKEILSSLLTYWPLVCWFSGPESVGKWATAEHLRRHVQIDNADTLRVFRLSPETSKDIVTFVSTPAARSHLKLVIVQVAPNTDVAQAMLLTATESPTARFVFVGQDLAPALRSRAQRYRFGYLTTEEVARVLEEKKDIAPGAAQHLATMSGGQVSAALKHAEHEKDIVTVRSALTALRSRDAEALEDLAGDWTDSCTEYLTRWCAENLSGRWRVFAPEDAVSGRALPIRVLRAIKTPVRPKLVVRSQLMEVLRGD